MPISYEIDHDRRLVTASARGTLTHEDVFGYQQEVWSRADVAEGREKTSKGLMAGKLVVTTDLASAAEALVKAGPARARVTLAVETDDPTPFLTSEELDLDRSGKGTIWTYEVSMTWPRQARRVSVLVEEIRTGLFGTASTELPR